MYTYTKIPIKHPLIIHVICIINLIKFVIFSS